ncbi:MAG: class I SAM-dependent methyltransferase, partial [Pseudomonadota bacterium]
MIDQIVDPSELYPKQYYSFSKGLEQLYSTKAGRKQISKIKKQFNELEREIKEYRVLGLVRDLELSREDRIADIGCGEGELLYLLRELGFLKAQGFEPFIEKSIHYSNGLKINKMTVEEIKDSFDYIMLNHSFEHMKNPIWILQKLREFMDGDEARLLI